MKTSKLIFLEETVLPTALIIGSKYISVFLLNLVLALEWEFRFYSSQVFSLPFVHYADKADLILVNSISSVIMTLVLTIGFSAALYRFQFFHENFITPKTSSRLHSKKIEYLIFKEGRAHSQITVWFTFAWFTFLVVLLEFLAGTVVLFVLSINFVIVLLLSSAVLVDAHKKGTIAKARHKR